MKIKYIIGIIVIVLILFIFLGAKFVFPEEIDYLIRQNTNWKGIVGLGCKTLNWDKSFCVDSMPDFPEKIGDFTLTRYSKVNWEEECKELGENTICTKSNSLEYYNSDNTRLIIVAPVFTSKGASYFAEYESQFKGGEISSNIFELKSKTLLTYKNKMFWRAKNIDMITIGQYAYEKKVDGSLKNIQIPSSFPLLTNEVSKFFLEKYPPIKK